MDEMKIASKFTRDIVSKLIKKALFKKAGYNVDIRLNGLYANVVDGKTHVHLDLDADFSKDELAKILKNFGL